MAESLVRHETPTEFFRDLVEAALQRQRISTSDETTFYVVNLLAGFVNPSRSGRAAADDALAVEFARAMQTGGTAQVDGLRRVGDLSLFTSGFFSDSLNRRIVDVDYYMALGARAYGVLAQCRTTDTLHDVFDELASRFPAFVDVLGEVSEQTRLTSQRDLLRVYERWLHTRSRRSGELLAARGIVPNAAAGSRRTIH